MQISRRNQLEAALDALFDASLDKVKFLRMVIGWHANFCAGCAASLDGGNKPGRCTCTADPQAGAGGKETK